MTSGIGISLFNLTNYNTDQIFYHAIKQDQVREIFLTPWKINSLLFARP